MNSMTSDIWVYNTFFTVKMQGEKGQTTDDHCESVKTAHSELYSLKTHVLEENKPV